MNLTSRRQATTFELEYWSPREDEELADVLAPLVGFDAVRVRRLHVPAAGADFYVAIIRFLGRTALEGLVGGYAIQLVQRLVEALRRARKGRTHALSSHIDQLTVSFDDLDVCIALPPDVPMERLPEVLSTVRDRVAVPPISVEPTHVVVLPAVQDSGNQWHLWSPDVDDPEPYPFRYWLLGVRDASGCSRVYDARENRVFAVSDLEAPWRHTNRHSRRMLSDPLEAAIARLRPSLAASEVRDWAGRVDQLAMALRVEMGPGLVCSDEALEELLSMCERADRGDLWR